MSKTVIPRGAYALELENWRIKKRDWYLEEIMAGRWNIGKFLAKAYAEEQAGEIKH